MDLLANSRPVTGTLGQRSGAALAFFAAIAMSALVILASPSANAQTAGCGSPGNPTQVAIAAIIAASPSQTSGSECYFTVDIPSGVAGATFQFTSQNSAHRIFEVGTSLNGTNVCYNQITSHASCDVNSPAPGTYYIKVVNSEGTSDQFTLGLWTSLESNCGLNGPRSAISPALLITGTFPVPGPSACYFTVKIPDGVTGATFQFSTANSAKKNFFVGTSLHGNNVCYTGPIASSKTCDLNSPAAGTYYITVTNDDGTTDQFTIGYWSSLESNCGLNGPQSALVPAQKIAGNFSVPGPSACYFTVKIPDGVTGATFQFATTNSAKRNFYVGTSLHGNNVCYTGPITSSKACDLNSPAAGTYYITVTNDEGTTDSFDVGYWSSLESNCGLSAGVNPAQKITGNFTVPGPSACYFTVKIPDGVTGATFQFSTANSAKKNFFVGTSLHGNNVCYTGSIASSKACDLSSPAAGTYYITVTNDEGTTDPFTVGYWSSLESNCGLNGPQSALVPAQKITGNFSVPGPSACYFTVKIPDGVTGTTFQFATKNSAKKNFYVGTSLHGNNVCYTGPIASSQTCDLNSPAAGTYYITVTNDDGTTDPFTITPASPPVAIFVMSVPRSPSSATAGQSVTASVTVTNSGHASGTTSVNMTVNGREASVRSVTLAAGASQTLNFEFTPQTAGEYDVFFMSSDSSEAASLPTINVVAPYSPPTQNVITSPTPRTYNPTNQPTQGLSAPGAVLAPGGSAAGTSPVSAFFKGIIPPLLYLGLPALSIAGGVVVVRKSRERRQKFRDQVAREHAARPRPEWTGERYHAPPPSPPPPRPPPETPHTENDSDTRDGEDPYAVLGRLWPKSPPTTPEEAEAVYAKIAKANHAHLHKDSSPEVQQACKETMIQANAAIDKIRERAHRSA